MRRGHPGIGGWRSDNPRPFRPRGGGTPCFRPSRSFSHAEAPRYHGSRALFPASGAYNNVNYRGSGHNQHRSQDRAQTYNHNQGQRQILPLYHRMRHGDVPDHANSHQDTRAYYDNNKKQCHINSMGDIDHRQAVNIHQSREPFIQRPSPWINPPYYDDVGTSKSYRHQDNADHSQITPPVDYGSVGHRPPASDHYGGGHGSTMENSNTFSRSIDDTVNIVRKRLLSRESQHSSEIPHQNLHEVEKTREPMTNTYSTPPEQPMKKKSHSSHKVRNVKSNCDKIKSKIVDQLFMMDKDKIHKLMDNPKSSSKFEYAISSLVTESQNSFNRHLRSVAEKSLGSSSTDFIHNDNNTIYEDTFMKEMQCLLDPQDSVLLEDLKPMVLAELSKVLQLDNFEQRYETDEASYSRSDQSQYNQYPDDTYSYDSYQSYDRYSPVNNHDNYYKQKPLNDQSNESYENETHDGYRKAQPLFEQRILRRNSHNRRSSSEKRRHDRQSLDNKTEESYRSVTPAPVFDPDVSNFSEEDDPFAELDKQYHVAVDHNFIENYDDSNPQASFKDMPQSPINVETSNKQQSSQKPFNNNPIHQIRINSPEKPLHKIKQEIDNQLQDMAKSPLKFSSHFNTIIKNEPETPEKQSEYDLKQDLVLGNSSDCIPTKQTGDLESKASDVFINQDFKPEHKVDAGTEKSESTGTMIKSSTPSHSRKRSIDQRPSHRKEKRKKSESGQSDSNKQILNKNIIINVNDCAAKSSENSNCDSPKSIFNLFFSKEKSTKDASKETKKIESGEKEYSDKYVKRKENTKKSKDKDKDNDTQKKHNSSSSSHSITPSDAGNTNVNTKSDGQTKLKPIDMFTEQPRKPSVHHAHRNTAITPTTPVKPVVISHKMTKRHVATQVLRKVMSKEVQTNESKSSSSRFSQTERKKLITRGAQTEPVTLKPATKSTEPLERMKEIDMEIQSLLQEKFKLYNSLESKESCTNTMQSLGMAVLNMTPVESDQNECNLAEDTIVDEFTSIPVEELEQIALESVQEESKNLTEKKNLHQHVIEQERKGSISPATSTNSTRSKKKGKINISLIEQIITDERPLEEIISLDDFETQVTKRKPKKTKKKGKTKKDTVRATQPVSNLEVLNIKECSVVLTREDLNKSLKKFQTRVRGEKKPIMVIIDDEEKILPADLGIETSIDVSQSELEATHTDEINDIQFDMLDVSEDIVIGDVCEIKSTGEKDLNDTSASTISEEIILDNSQSSVEEVPGPEAASEECKMYDYSSDESLRRDSITVSGNGDAILAIECVENNFLAASLDGNVYFFSGDGQLLNTLRGSNLPVTCLTIVNEKYGTTVYTGSLDSRIRYFDLETGLEKGPECNVLSPIQSMDRAWETIFVGTRTGFVLQFECKNNMLIPVSSVKFSEQSILALRAMKEGPRKVLLVAARSESVTIRDAQSGLMLRMLDGPKMTVYSLLFEDGKVFCGTSSHQIHVFDYSSGSHVGTHSGGKGAVCLRATGGLVFAGCYDGCVYVYREGDERPLAQLRGPGLMLLSLALVGSKIIAGYKDRSLYIWKIPLSILQEMIL